MNDGGPAFPSEQGQGSDGKWNQTYESGMSLRDYFAGRALCMLANSKVTNETPAEVALACYIMANAMIKQREKEAK